MKYFDAHCHVQFDKFDSDRDEMVEKMRARRWYRVVYCDFETSRLAVEMADENTHLFASVAALHFNDNADEEFDMKAYRYLAEETLKGGRDRGVRARLFSHGAH